MRWRRNIPIHDRRKSVSSDLMLPVTSVSINWTWISEHYLQEPRNSPILVPPQTNIWTIQELKGPCLAFPCSLSCYRSVWKLWWDYYTISWYIHHTVSDTAVLLMVPDATWHEQLLNGGLIPYFSPIFCWAERLVEQESSHILTR